MSGTILRPFQSTLRYCYSLLILNRFVAFHTFYGGIPSPAGRPLLSAVGTILLLCTLVKAPRCNIINITWFTSASIHSLCGGDQMQLTVLLKRQNVTAFSAITKAYRAFATCDKVITTMMIRPLDDRTYCVRSSVADLKIWTLFEI